MVFRQNKESMDKKKSLIGAHISISGGFDKIFARGESIGCNAIQIFTKSNRQWNAKQIEQNEVELYNKAKKESSIKSIIAHAGYLINIGSSNKATAEKSVQSLTEELNRCYLLDIKYLVLHPGSKQESSEKECLDLIAQRINSIFEVTKQTSILLENMAGQGNSVAYKFEQLQYIISKIEDKKRIGICFDTCHAFAAGYNFSTQEGYNKVFEEFDKIIGIDLLKAMHINESKKAAGSKVDRHANLTKGEIGMTAFELIFKDERFKNIPKILETPVDVSPEGFIPDMQIIQKLL